MRTRPPLAHGARPALLGLVMALLACPASDPDPDDTVADSEGSDATAGQGAAETEDGASGNGGSGPTEPEPGQTDGETGASDGIVDACEAYCDRIAMCSPDEVPSFCVEACVDESLEGDPPCVAAAADFFACMGAATCEQLQGEGSVCAAEEQAIDEACAGDVCTVGVGGDETSCGYVSSCPDLRQEMSCDQTTCTCLQDDVEVGSCDAMAICASVEGLIEYAATCCGFV